MWRLFAIFDDGGQAIVLATVIIPEPTTLFLAAIGLAALGLGRWRITALADFS